MTKLFSYFVIIAACTCLAGCGTSPEVAPLTEAGTDPPPEQQKNWQEESMKRGSAPAGYEPSAESK